LRIRVLVLLTSAILSVRLWAQEVEQFTAVEVEHLKDLERKNDNLMNIHGVYGVGGTKSRGKIVLHIFVDHIRFKGFNRLDLMSLLNVQIGANDEVEFIEIPEIVARGDVGIGASTSNTAGCMKGTIGLTAQMGDDPGYLTANHVAAAQEYRLCPNVGDQRTQMYPATATTPDCRDTAAIGRLGGWNIIRWFGSGAPNMADAAFVVQQPVGAVETTTKCGVDIPWIATSVTPADAYNKKVQKCGAATKLTTGYVTDPMAKVWVRYKCGLRAKFENQIGIQQSMFSAHGDSGAPVFMDESPARVVGVVFAGAGDWTWANPIDMVLKELKTASGKDVRLCPQFPCPP
jgi:hypothetical protein